MKKIILSLFACFAAIQVSFAQCSIANATTTLDVNNVKATLDVGGVLWRNAGHIYPNLGIPDIEVASMFSGGLWLGGIDNSGNVRISESTYVNSFSAGPIIDMNITPQMCENFNRFWTVDRADVIAHQMDFADNGQIDNAIPVSILSWPGNGNPNSVESNGFELPDVPLAPFWDENGDGIYNAEDGDYPLMKGDQSTWWMYNTFNPNGGNNLNIAVMAFAAASTDEHINNTTFYNYTITNASDQNYSDFAISFWFDFDLGCFTDDYFGSIPEGNLAYVYNQDEIDGTNGASCLAGVNTYAQAPPIVIVKMIEGPANGQGSTADLSAVTYYNNGALGGIPGTTDPNTPEEYYNYMTGKWRDGSVLTSEGDGYNTGGIETTFAYNDAPDLDGGWSMCESNSPEADRRVVMSTEISNLFSGQMTSVTYAVSHLTGVPLPCPSVSAIVQTAVLLDQACQELTVTSTKTPINTTADITLSPNPFTSAAQLTINDTSLTMNHLSIFATNGQMVKELSMIAAQQVEITKDDLSAGMYYYKMSLSDGSIATGKLIIQ